MSADANLPLQEESGAARHRHRRNRTALVVGGALVGLAVGLVLLYAIGRWRDTGTGGNPFVVLFGLPVFTAVIGAVLGWLFAGIDEHGIPDAPVRSRRFAERGVAATSVHGQLPGSPVAPREVTEDRRDGRSGEHEARR